MDKLLSTEGVRLCASEPDIDENSSDFQKLKEIASRLEKSGTYLRKYSSYKLKHVFERYLKDVTDGDINHVHNGELIKAMELAGHIWKRCSPSSKNAYFKISSRSLKPFACYLDNFNMRPKSEI